MENRGFRVLLVDASASSVRELSALLKGAGLEVHLRREAARALSDLSEIGPDILLCEQHLPGALSGIDLLRYAKRRNPDLPVVIIASHGDERAAVEAMRLGAHSYLPRPLKSGELVATLLRAVDAGSFRREMRRRCLETASTELVGRSEAMRKVRELVADVADTPATVLLLGATGTGKELVAREIHRASPRAEQRFIAVNCAAIPESLIEAELFGHTRGAYTGADRDRDGKILAANGGTLMLDEIGDLPQQIQPTLLRFLEEGTVTPLGSDEPRPVDVRFIAATHHNLERDVQDGTFREDLFYRLNVVPIRLPSLSDRKEDIPDLIEHLLPRHAERHHRVVNEITPDVCAWLQRQDWPGNVRELENALERLVVFCKDGILRLPESAGGDQVLLPFQEEKQRLIEEFELSYLTNALAACGGKLKEISHRSGISPRQLYNLLRKHGLQTEHEEEQAELNK